MYRGCVKLNRERNPRDSATRVVHLPLAHLSSAVSGVTPNFLSLEVTTLRWLHSRHYLSALALSALREWHYLLGCASAQVQSSLKEIPSISFVVTDAFVMTDNIKEIPLFSFVRTDSFVMTGKSFIFICDDFICDDRQTNTQTELFFNMELN